MTSLREKLRQVIPLQKAVLVKSPRQRNELRFATSQYLDRLALSRLKAFLHPSAEFGVVPQHFIHIVRGGTPKKAVAQSQADFQRSCEVGGFGDIAILRTTGPARDLTQDHLLSGTTGEQHDEGGLDLR